MCLTIPKKVVELKKDFVVTEDHNGNRQELKTLIELAIGDFVISQQNVVVEIVESEYANEIFDMIRTKGDI